VAVDEPAQQQQTESIALTIGLTMTLSTLIVGMVFAGVVFFVFAAGLKRRAHRPPGQLPIRRS
jgi:heme/copper-type cytochrome/quinol oxidase subunit 2